jgi:hypothetical protein
MNWHLQAKIAWLGVGNLTNSPLLAAISALIQTILSLHLLNPELIRGSLEPLINS